MAISRRRAHACVQARELHAGDIAEAFAAGSNRRWCKKVHHRSKATTLPGCVVDFRLIGCSGAIFPDNHQQRLASQATSFVLSRITRSHASSLEQMLCKRLLRRELIVKSLARPVQQLRAKTKTNLIDCYNYSHSKG